MREREERENVSYILTIYTTHYKNKNQKIVLYFCFYLVKSLIVISHHSVICFEEILVNLLSMYFKKPFKR